MALDERYYLVRRGELGYWGNQGGSTKEELNELLQQNFQGDDMVVIRGVECPIRVGIADRTVALKLSDVLSRSADKLEQTRGEYISPAGVDAVGALVIAGNLADWENGTLEAAYGGDWHTASYKCGDCAPNNYTLREYLVHLNDKHEWTFGQIAAHLQGRYGL